MEEKQLERIEEQKAKLKALSEYEVYREEWIEEMQSVGMVLRHIKSGARLVLIMNDDQNKVFNIAFRTPTPDNTGVPHILEHSVLCGSKKYPLKDPFIELAKGSLNTFLNAMTYPEKTMYPVASCNDKDFHNLMDVYLDAVFHPNIYIHDEIFRQEGWSYHMDSLEDELTINGVVYNEMKGAFSDAEEVLERVILNALFPDTSYANESGGDPQFIPQLTYEQFLAFHSRYYHPSNSYIYLYGDMDMEKTLQWMDKEYLSAYEYEPVDSSFEEQKPFEQMREVRTEFSITANEPKEKQSFLSYSAVIGDYLDAEKFIAFQVLEYALFNMPGAPVKRALLDAGIGVDVYGDYEYGFYQPYFSVVAKKADPDQNEAFLRILKEELQKAVDGGIEKKSLEAGLSSIEFKTREADFGDFPKGLLQGITMFHTWLYDDLQPFAHVKTNDVFDSLKKKIKTDYFEKLVKTYLLDNTHAANVIAVPQVGLNEKKEAQLAQKLADKKATMSKEELQKIVDDTKELEAYQEKPTPQEDLKRIPLVEIKDIKKDPEPFDNDKKIVDGMTVLHHNFFTNQIGYLVLAFEANTIKEEWLPYLGLYKLVFGMLDTEHYTYQELANETTANLGGINIGNTVYRDAKKGTTTPKLMTEIRVKCMYDKLPFAFQVVDEIVSHTKYKDKKRFHEIISSAKARLEVSLVGNGNRTTAVRAMSYYSPAAYMSERLKGVEFYYFLKELDEHFDSRFEETVTILNQMVKQVFTRDHMLVSFAADETGYEKMQPELVRFIATLPKEAMNKERLVNKTSASKNEGFQTSSQVQYVACAGDFKKAGYEYTGAMRVMSTIMSYDYLWNNVRVKGGAYGCSCSINRNGDCFFTSYRDPNVKRTLDVYREVGKYLHEFTADERTMQKYIIGTISDMDTPLTSSSRAGRSYAAYVMNLEYEQLKQERTQVLHTTQKQICELENVVMAAVNQNYVCALGSGEKIAEDKEQFDEIKNLLENVEMES